MNQPPLSFAATDGAEYEKAWQEINRAQRKRRQIKPFLERMPCMQIIGDFQGAEKKKD